MPRGKSPATKSCAACNLSITDRTDKNILVCKNTKCNNTFHSQCLPSIPVDKSNWICPECKCATKKGGDTSSTPVRVQSTPVIATSQASNATTISQDDFNIWNSEISALTNEFRLFRQEFNTMKQQLSEAIVSMTRCHETLDDYSTKMQTFDGRLKELEDQQSQYVGLQTRITDLQERLNNQAQSALRNEIEIHGITETPNENPYHIALTIANKIGTELSELDIEHATRAGTRRNEKEKNIFNPRPFVIKFTRRAKRDEFLRNAKSRRGVKAGDVDGTTNTTRIFFNERLTRENRLLFRDTRRMAKEAGYQYCWTRNGSIFVRKREGAGVHRIQSKTDIENLNSSPSNLFSQAEQ